MLRTFKRTILFKRIIETLILKRVATAAKARAAFYFNSLWQSSISKFNFPQVTCITLLFIAWVFVATERKLVFVRLHSAMTVFLVLLKAVLTSLSGHLWLRAEIILYALSLIDSMAWKTIDLQLFGRFLLRAFWQVSVRLSFALKSFMGQDCVESQRLIENQTNWSLLLGNR